MRPAAAEPLGGFGEAPAPQMQDAGEHVDQRGDVLAPRLPLAAARLFHQGLDARNVAEPELDKGERQEIFRIVGIDFESPLKQVKRALRVRRQNERALMAQRRGGLARGTLGLGALGLRHLGEDLGGGRAVPRFELGDRPPRRPGVRRIEREHGLGDQGLDAVALFQREAVAILLRTGSPSCRRCDGDLLGHRPVSAPGPCAAPGAPTMPAGRAPQRARQRSPRRTRAVVQSSGKTRVKDSMALIGHSPLALSAAAATTMAPLGL